MSGKINYEHECLAYLRLKESGEEVTQADYCSKRSQATNCTMSVPYFKKVLRKVKAKGSIEQGNKSSNLARIPKFDSAGSNPEENVSKKIHRDYEQLKLEWLSGSWPTISSFARHLEINPLSTHFRKKTKGWRKEKKLLDKRIDEMAVDILAEKHVAHQVRNIYGYVQDMEWKLMGVVQKIIGGIMDWQPINSVNAAHTAALAIKELHAVLKNMAPFLQGLEKLEEVNQVFDRCGKGELDITNAIIELMKLGVEVPKSMQIMLSKGIGEELPTDDDDIISLDKIMQHRAQILQEIETQRIQFVPTRTYEVQQIKKELAGSDSFAQQKLEDENGR